MNKGAGSYIYEYSDKLALKKHIKEQKKIPIHFQNSFADLIRMRAWDEILKWNLDGKDIIKRIEKLKHHMLSD